MRCGDSRSGVLPGLPFTRVATGDLEIPIVGQLPTADLPLRSGVRTSGKQDLGDAPGNAHHTPLVFADAYAELDDGALRVQAGVGQKAAYGSPTWKSPG
jgi:hypothetical protein